MERVGQSRRDYIEPAYQSIKGPVMNAVHVIVCSMDFRYATTLGLASKKGTMSIIVCLEVSIPNSPGRNRLTPALTAASMIVFWSEKDGIVMVLTIASWPWKAATSES